MFKLFIDSDSYINYDNLLKAVNYAHKTKMRAFAILSDNNTILLNIGEYQYFETFNTENEALKYIGSFLN